MAFIGKLTSKKAKDASDSSSPRYRRLCECKWECECRVRKGYVPVMVGAAGEGGCRERFHIPTWFVGHPSIVSLLELSADEYGYRQEGVIHIPCHPDCFREIIHSLT